MNLPPQCSSNTRSPNSEGGGIEPGITPYPPSDQTKSQLQPDYPHLRRPAAVDIGSPPLLDPPCRAQLYDIHASNALPPRSNSRINQFSYVNSQDGFPFRTSYSDGWDENQLERQNTSASFPRYALNRIPRRPVPQRNYGNPLSYTSLFPNSPERISGKPLTYASFAGCSPYNAPSIRPTPSPRQSQITYSNRRWRFSSLGSQNPKGRLNLTRSANAEHAPSHPTEEPANLRPELPYVHITPRAHAHQRNSSLPRRTNPAIPPTTPLTLTGTVISSATHLIRNPNLAPRASTTAQPSRTAALCETCCDNISRHATIRLEKTATVRYWLTAILCITLWLPLIAVFFWRTAVVNRVGPLWSNFGNRVILCICSCGVANIARWIGRKYLVLGLRKDSPYGHFTILVAAAEGLVCAGVGAAALVWFAGQIVFWRLDKGQD